MLTHWARVTHICITKRSIICPRQAIIWTNIAILLIWQLKTKFSETLIKIHIFSFKKMHLNRSSVKCRPFCLVQNVSILSSNFVDTPNFNPKWLTDTISDHCPTRRSWNKWHIPDALFQWNCIFLIRLSVRITISVATIDILIPTKGTNANVKWLHYSLTYVFPQLMSMWERKHT